ncbi:MAG: EAL domain-containing protein [Actinomycetota bacterium]
MPDHGRSTSRRAAWLVYLVLGSGLTAAYFGWPGHHLQVWTPLGLSAVVATVVGVRLHRPALSWAWYLLAAALLCFISGDTTYTVLTEVLHRENPFPSVADAFYLAVYPLWAVAILAMTRSRSRGVASDRGGLLDSLILTTGLGLLSWVYLVVPNFQAEGATLTQRLVSVAYPLGDVLVLSMLARLVTTGGLRVRSVRWLALGGAALLAADVSYGLSQLDGSWMLGGPTDLGWAVFYVAFGVAALHPSSAEVGEPVLRRSTHVRTGRILGLAAVSLIAPGMLLVEAATGTVEHAAAIAVFSAALYLLVIARLAGIVAGHRQAVERERVLRVAGEHLVAAQDLDDVFGACLGAVKALGAGSSTWRAGIYLADGEALTQVAASGPDVDAAADRPLWDPADPDGRLTERGTVSVSPLLLDGAPRGILVVRAAIAMTADEHGAVSALASQTALAVESETLGEDLRRRQNEEHFRALIQNASDVIIVVDAEGSVTYATPSLERALGHPVADVVGTALSALLHADDRADLRDALAHAGLHPERDRPQSDWRLRDGDGDHVSFEVVFSNLLADASVAGVVLTMRDVSDRRALEQQLKHQAYHDSLTGLPNRVLFQDRAEQALRRAERTGALLAMVMLDLDDFKVVNDTRGHGAGDELLRQAAQRLLGAMRHGDTAARFGGDEFALLIEDAGSAEDVEDLAGRIVASFARPFELSGDLVYVHVSAGLVVAGGRSAFSLAELLRCSDLALYTAKERGKDQVVRYHDDLHARLLDRLSRREDLRRGVAAGEFVLHYQPIVSLLTQTIVGAEALIRWQHPAQGLVAPLDFIELAEDTGLIVDLGRWALDAACAQARAWSESRSGPLRLAVNVSGRQLQEVGFVAEVSAALQRHGVPAHLLVIELTETVLVRDGSAVAASVDALKALGVRIAIDDFGTGYSGLGYLQRLPIDILKVDKSFVDGLGAATRGSGAVAHAIVSLAQSLQLEVIAEGIELQAQADELLALGCPLGQGYLFARPVTAEALTLLRDAPLRPAPTTDPVPFPTPGRPRVTTPLGDRR